MQQQQGEQQGRRINWSSILMFAMFYWFLFGKKNTAPQTDPVTGATLPPISNVYRPDTKMDLWVYLSEDKYTVPFNDPNALIWKETGIIYGSWDESNIRKKSIEIETTESMRKNGTIYAHSYFVHPRTSPNKSDPNYKPYMLYHVHQLNKYIKNVAQRKKNLLSGELSEEWQSKEQEDESVTKIVTVNSHWKGNFTLNLVTDFTQYPRGGIPDQIAKHFSYDKLGNYYPVVFGNDFWLLNEDLHMINDSVKTLKLDMHFEPLSLWKWSLYTQMEDSFSLQRDMFAVEEGESEDFKRLLLDNHPYVLALTFVISILHTILDVLAFKNDIQFWRNKKSMEGLSIRTIYVNVICNLIIFLYLLDNDTSWMVLFSVFLGLIIEVWKITRAVHVSIGYYHSIPYPIFKDKNSYLTETKQHDLYAMKYLYYALYPIVIGYAIYALYYENHKSWYSWVIGTLAGCVYTFGFIMMTPQLFINYKLKSVAHLPWRVFIYKAISTFIDDLFAFLIRMPTMHRLRVFRDDLVFFIYLYQRWIYPVDKKRIEVGADFEDVTLAEIAAAKAEALAAENTTEQSGNPNINLEQTEATTVSGKEKTE